MFGCCWFVSYLVRFWKRPILDQSRACHHNARPYSVAFVFAPTLVFGTVSFLISGLPGKVVVYWLDGSCEKPIIYCHAWLRYAYPSRGEWFVCSRRSEMCFLTCRFVCGSVCADGRLRLEGRGDGSWEAEFIPGKLIPPQSSVSDKHSLRLFSLYPSCVMGLSVSVDSEGNYSRMAYNSHSKRGSLNHYLFCSGSHDCKRIFRDRCCLLQPIVAAEEKVGLPCVVPHSESQDCYQTILMLLCQLKLSFCLHFFDFITH